MRTRWKFGLVLGGYVVALAIAVFGVVVADSYAANEASQGMLAFAELLLFGGVFSVLSLIPTGFALFWLRPYPSFWCVLAAMSLLLAACGPLAALGMGHVMNPAWMWVQFFGLLNVLGAPILALAFLICAAIAPARMAKRAFLGAAAGEVVVSAYAFLCLIILKRWLV